MDSKYMRECALLKTVESCNGPFLIQFNSLAMWPTNHNTPDGEPHCVLRSKVPYSSSLSWLKHDRVKFCTNFTPCRRYVMSRTSCVWRRSLVVTTKQWVPLPCPFCTKTCREKKLPQLRIEPLLAFYKIFNFL